MKLKQCTDLFILSKDKRPVDSSGRYSTIDGAAHIPYTKFKAARDHGFTISIKLGPIGATGYSIYCIDCDHCDFNHPVYKWIKQTADTPQLIELSSSGAGAHIFIVKKTTEDFETRFMDFTGQQLEVWCRVRHIVSPMLETIVDQELCEHNVALFDKLIELSDEQERLKAEAYEREREKQQKAKQKKNYKFVRPDTDIANFAKVDRRLKEILEADPFDVDNSANDLALVRKICYYFDTSDKDIVKDVFERTEWFAKKDDRHLQKFYRPGYLDRLISLGM